MENVGLLGLYRHSICSGNGDEEEDDDDGGGGEVVMKLMGKLM